MLMALKLKSFACVEFKYMEKNLNFDISCCCLVIKTFFQTQKEIEFKSYY
jgi:hypothetical protein